MKHVLVLASVASMIDQFNIPNILLLKEMGYEVDVACNFVKGSTCTDEKIIELQDKLNKMNVNWYQIDFARNVFGIKENLKAYMQVRSLLREKKYSFIHCHSPIGGVVGRVAGARTKTKVIYTAHGFHFYKGAPLKNWVLYYPIEKICSCFTDILVCINKEDFCFAKQKMWAKKIEYVPGIGVNLEKFSKTVDASKKREELGIPLNKRWFLTVGELSKRKNQENLIRAVASFDDIYLTIAGKGDLFERYQVLIDELGIGERVKLLGFRTDIAELCISADVFAFPSLQEGLPVALMEAMACGKPVICSRIRGNIDLIEDGRGGYLFDPYSISGIKNAIEKIMVSDLNKFGSFNATAVSEYALETVMDKTRSIYINMQSGN